ncbi:hypothetical protein KC19_2G063000 [Ceratodon purpureus]|uniref:Uncharacterized protein n=1 Tax=Ceratodon purpureus TaxID=3225 RepID=A0A8T0ITH4_CERPU|nr:hypothetical protein KC19_2G063000 [Ceratodon purpureus]
MGQIKQYTHHFCCRLTREYNSQLRKLSHESHTCIKIFKPPQILLSYEQSINPTTLYSSTTRHTYKPFPNPKDSKLLELDRLFVSHCFFAKVNEQSWWAHHLCRPAIVRCHPLACPDEFLINICDVK